MTNSGFHRWTNFNAVTWRYGPLIKSAPAPATSNCASGSGSSSGSSTKAVLRSECTNGW